MFIDRMPETMSDDVPDEEPDVGLLPPGVLQQMIQQLSPGYRAVLNLFVFEQQSHHEIAQRLGISESTSASQFLRAKRQLARMIREYINNPRI
jgi:RNA polymerase sigma-70 factor (ECF subfamily)